MQDQPKPPRTATEVPGLSDVLAPDGYLIANSKHGYVGRDALGAARLLHPFAPELAERNLRFAAAFQATESNSVWDKEWGKLPHEVMKDGEWRLPTYLGLPVPSGGFSYYGSADVTAEWLTLLALAATDNPALARDLETHWRAAGEQLLHRLAIGGGLVRWGPRALPGTGLEAQARRDEKNLRCASGSMLHRDGTPPRPPVADWETQASALVGLRGLHRISGNPEHLQAAAALEARVSMSFAPGSVALDTFDRPVVLTTTAPGALLWAGGLSGEAAQQAADRLLKPDILTPYGLRNVAATERLYDPIGSRRGRIYPYDSYLAACGLVALDRSLEAKIIVNGLAAAIDALGDYPESWAVMDGELAAPGARCSAFTIAVRNAIEHGHWDSAAGLCEPLLPRL